ncbi:hypothetical protein [Mucilaginibacter ginkgonis]|nr:hypothetical protein [Mucilaginibacter ginkgonis]
MKTINATQILVKSVDIELKKLLLADLKNFKAQSKGISQGTQKAA